MNHQANERTITLLFLFLSVIISSCRTPTKESYDPTFMIDTVIVFSDDMKLNTELLPVGSTEVGLFGAKT